MEQMINENKIYNAALYCRASKDTTDDVWETVLDVGSLAASVVEVAINPTYLWAWAGLVDVAVDHTKQIPLNNYLGDTVVSIRWKVSSDSERAFIEEYAMQLLKGVNNKDTYNKIWSPGKKYII